MLTVALTVLVLQGSPQKAKAPSPAEKARSSFVAGNLAKAQEWARQAAKRDPKSHKTLVKQLADYAGLVSKADTLSPQEARELLELDHSISPDQRGKLTERAFERFVTSPLELATLHAQQGHADSARVLAKQVLDVDPSNTVALALVQSSAGEH